MIITTVGEVDESETTTTATDEVMITTEGEVDESETTTTATDEVMTINGR